MKLKQIAIAVALSLVGIRERLGECFGPGVPSRFGQSGAVVNTKSTIVTNADSTPRLESKLWYDGARVYESVATLEMLAADDDNSIYRFFRVRSNWRITSLEFANDVVTGNSANDIGLYDTVDNGAAVVASCGQLWASAVDFTSAHAFTDYTYEATATNIDKVDKQIWELAGLTTDPGKEYDICIKATTACTGTSGTVSARMKYIKGQ